MKSLGHLLSAPAVWVEKESRDFSIVKEGRAKNRIRSSH
jgi:hypothetical protein